MSTDESPSGPSGARLGGFALIGVGLLAGVFGVATVVSGAPQNGPQPPGDNVAAPTPSQGRQSSEQPPEKPQTQEQPSTPSKQTTEPGSPETTSPGQTSEGQPPHSPGKSQQIVVRVYNNSMITGLANDAAEDFRRAGYKVPEIGGYSSGVVYETTIYFRPGTGEEAQAREIGKTFGVRVLPRFPGLEQASPGVIAIITKDYQGIDGK